jgi:hypothetical protein
VLLSSPFYGGFLSNFVTAVIGIVVGITLLFEFSIPSSYARRENLIIIWAAKGLIYLRNYTGSLAVFLSVLHLVNPALQGL